MPRPFVTTEDGPRSPRFIATPGHRGAWIMLIALTCLISLGILALTRDCFWKDCRTFATVYPGQVPTLASTATIVRDCLRGRKDPGERADYAPCGDIASLEEVPGVTLISGSTASADMTEVSVGWVEDERGRGVMLAARDDEGGVCYTGWLNVKYRSSPIFERRADTEPCQAVLPADASALPFSRS